MWFFGFKDTVLSRALLSLHGELLEITLTVTLVLKFRLFVEQGCHPPCGRRSHSALNLDGRLLIFGGYNG